MLYAMFIDWRITYIELLLEQRIAASQSKSFRNRIESRLTKIEKEHKILVRWDPLDQTFADIYGTVIEQRLSVVVADFRFLFANCRFLEYCKAQHAG